MAANYRLSPGVMHPAHVQDAAAATAWVYNNIAEFGGDPQNIYVSGHSAGAYLAATGNRTTGIALMSMGLIFQVLTLRQLKAAKKKDNGDAG